MTPYVVALVFMLLSVVCGISAFMAGHSALEASNRKDICNAIIFTVAASVCSAGAIGLATISQFVLSITIGGGR